jgi:hypothetical protein
MRVKLAFAFLVVASELNASDDPIQFFEKRIRPVLINECYSCHSSQAKSIKGGLSLEFRESILKGGDTGSSLVPKKPSESLLLSALKHDGDVQMPPKGKLPDSVIRDFEQWIAMGAPDPRTEKPKPAAAKTAVKDHWAYRPPRWSPPPTSASLDWQRDPLDGFILADLHKKNLAPSKEADRAALLRRVHVDLVGLPPTPEEIDAFLADDDPAADERVVDRLLASPAFGERWGRHWLDVARFAESLTLRGFLLKESWRYRDYVIDSFNDDAPFDKFIREQIAGDLMQGGDWKERQRRLTAVSFLMLGDSNLEEQDKKQLRMDVVDEQLDAVTKGFLAQTVTCARCHDHKFDPIPTKDYYALAGIFRNVKSMEHANVSQLTERPLPMDAEAEQRFTRHAELLKSAKAELAAARKKRATLVAAKGPVKATTLPGVIVDDEQAKRVGNWKHSVHSGTYVERGYIHDENANKGSVTLTFQPELPATGRYEVRLAYSPGTSRASNVPVTVFSADGEKTLSVDMKKTPSLDGRFVSLGSYKFEKTGQSFVIIANENTKGHVTADAVAFIPEEQAAKTKPSNNADKEIARCESELKRLESMPEARRPAVVAATEETKIEETRVHIRGSVHSLGEPAPRGVLTCASYGTPPTFPADQSGRLELAQWIASRGNPLTARVIVNRVWHWLFGAGIVQSPDNFGTTGDLPTNPELLDRLAIDFKDDGWSVKRLVRKLVLSATYRQSIAASPALLAADPENKLWGRANKKRLDAEVIRDAMLFAAGTLDRRMSGPEYGPELLADYGYKNSSSRRSVYLPVFRNAMPEPLTVFDFADPGAPTGRRNVSTVSIQALYMTNHPFVVDSAKRIAEKVSPFAPRKVSPSNERSETTVRLFRTLLCRSPSERELQIAEKADLECLVHALLCSSEFRHVE